MPDAQNANTGRHPTAKGPDAPSKEKWSTAIAIAGIAVSLVAVLATLHTTTQMIDSTHTESEQARRATAYAEYVGSLEKYNEFIFGNLYWAGSNVSKGAREKGQEETNFWQTAQALQVELSSNYARASMFSHMENKESTDGLLQLIETLNKDQQDSFLKFKCMSKSQDNCMTEDAGKIEPGTHAEIREMLTTWSGEFEMNKKKFIQCAGAALHDDSSQTTASCQSK